MEGHILPYGRNIITLLMIKGVINTSCGRLSVHWKNFQDDFQVKYIQVMTRVFCYKHILVHGK